MEVGSSGIFMQMAARSILYRIEADAVVARDLMRIIANALSHANWKKDTRSEAGRKGGLAKVPKGFSNKSALIKALESRSTKLS